MRFGERFNFPLSGHFGNCKNERLETIFFREEIIWQLSFRTYAIENVMKRGFRYISRLEYITVT